MPQSENLSRAEQLEADAAELERMSNRLVGGFAGDPVNKLHLRAIAAQFRRNARELRETKDGN